MIVKNEEANLPRCLKSIQAVVDEIVVLDTGSTDNTVAIAQSFEAKVEHFPWCEDFAAARNESLKYANGDWILVLDADEVLSAAVVPSLKQAITSEQHLVVNLVRQEVGAEQSPYSLVSRLFRRHPDLHFSRPYHAMIDDSAAELLQREPHWQIGSLPEVAILHEGYQTGAIASRDKFYKARVAMEGFLAKHPTDPYVCSKLGALYVQLGKVEQGVALLKRGLATHPTDPSTLYELHYHLGIAYSRMSAVVEVNQAEAHYQAATQQPVLPKLKLGAYNNWGNLLKARGDLQGARTAYKTVLQIDPHFAVGHYNLGMVLKAMGAFQGAIAAYQQAIHLNPHYAEAYQNLGVVLMKIGKTSESLKAFQEAIALHEQQNPLEAKRLRQGLSELGWNV